MRRNRCRRTSLVMLMRGNISFRAACAFNKTKQKRPAEPAVSGDRRPRSRPRAAGALSASNLQQPNTTTTTTAAVPSANKRPTNHRKAELGMDLPFWNPEISTLQQPDPSSFTWPPVRYRHRYDDENDSLLYFDPKFVYPATYAHDMTFRMRFLLVDNAKESPRNCNRNLLLDKHFRDRLF